MKLSINSTNALIGINTTKSQMQIRQPKGKLSIQHTDTSFEVTSEKPRIIIDQYQCFAESGLKNNIDLSKDNSQYSKQKAIEGIRRRVEDGNRLANIKKGMPNAITELATKNCHGPKKEFNMITMPRSRPKIDVTGYINIKWNMGTTDINCERKEPIVNLNRGKVDIYIRQKNNIEIRFIDEKK
ncbi:DUF6470 family protein [Abyssisolibacter fermentans]|uniref:DUF6470 family protein n=1 Tax=Abyssisolibacter fermentans TaxID=1766203 RepID=UPI00082D1D2E|nr:DUF6470 family protein [Abyssisolibacter fermentans]